VISNPAILWWQKTREAAAGYGLQRVGHVASIREQFCAISPERRLKQPAVIAITEKARHTLFLENESSIS
jgi:LysR family transcriptional activator of nhaA